MSADHSDFNIISNARSSQPASPLGMSRRSLLLLAGSWLIAQGLSGCGARGPASLNVEFLDSSFPSSLLKEFQRDVTGEQVNFVPVERLSQLYDHLVAAQQAAPRRNQALSWLRRLFGGETPDAAASDSSSQSPDERLTRPADWLTLGDYWLAAAITHQLIEPLDQAMLPGWSELPEAWQTLVRRDEQGNVAENGKIWGAPYRWGNLAIAYQIEAFETLGWMPTDWSDLWRDELTEKISLLDSPRAVIGLVLKHLGQSFNTTDLASVSTLSQTLADLHEQVKIYSSTAYLQPLLLGDTWLAVGWSSDILPLLRRDPRYGAVVPQSGTALFADVWVRPALPRGSAAQSASTANSSAPQDELEEQQRQMLSQWIEFCWQPDTAQRLSIQSYAASPMLVTSDRTQLPEALREENVLLPDADVIADSEFILPLAEAAIAQYRDLWIKMRRGELS